MTKADIYDAKKRQFADVLKGAKGIVTDACRALNLSRQTYYQWRNLDPEFAKECDEAQEVTIDFVESKLMENIAKNDSTCIIFYMKTKAKHRGYVERSEITGKDGGSIKNDVKLSPQDSDLFDTALERIRNRAIAEYKKNGREHGSDCMV